MTLCRETPAGLCHLKLLRIMANHWLLWSSRWHLLAWEARPQWRLTTGSTYFCLSQIKIAYELLFRPKHRLLPHLRKWHSPSQCGQHVWHALSSPASEWSYYPKLMCYRDDREVGKEVMCPDRKNDNIYVYCNSKPSIWAPCTTREILMASFSSIS